MKGKRMFPTIEKWLHDGAKIHGFSSGGRVRVLRIDNMKKKGYAEGANIDEAFHELEKNLKSGKDGICYMTGAYSNGEFDKWSAVRGGFDISYNKDRKMVEIVLNWLHFHGAPREVVNTVQKTRKAMVATDLTGRSWYVYPSHFPGNKEPCVGSQQIDASEEEKKNFSESRQMTLGAETLENLLESLETCLPTVER